MMSAEEQTYFQQMEQELETARLENQRMRNDIGKISMFSEDKDGNLIQWQLDLNEELERIDHLLRGHIIKRDKDGNEFWDEPDDERLKPFNEYGVQLLMNVISFYLNRNTILSNYKEDMINWKIKDLGDEIADLIFMKYDEMGMNTDEKKRLFPIVVRQIIDSIHSAYLRALHGGERESLRTARHVTQSDNPNLNQMYRHPTPPQKTSFFKPWTWGK